MLIVLSIAAFYQYDSHGVSGLSAQPIPGPLAGSSSPGSSSPSSLSPVVLISPNSVESLSPGSTFAVKVEVNNMDQFNGWDIQVVTYYSVLNATGLSITGNDFAVNASSGTAFEIVHCINGAGTGCTSSDGPGIVHSAYGNTATLTGDGLLFTITFRVTSNQPWCPISLKNDLISSPSSGNGVAHISISSAYGALPDGAGGGEPLRAE